MSEYEVVNKFVKLIERLFPEWLKSAKARASEMEEAIRLGNPAYVHWGAEKLAAGFITRCYTEEKGTDFDFIAFTNKEIEELLNKSDALEIDDSELRFRIRGIVGDTERFE